MANLSWQCCLGALAGAECWLPLELGPEHSSFLQSPPACSCCFPSEAFCSLPFITLLVLLFFVEYFLTPLLTHLPYDPWEDLILRPPPHPTLPPSWTFPSFPLLYTELTGGVALDFNLWVHPMGLLTAGGGMALDLGSRGTLRLLVLGGRWKKIKHGWAPSPQCGCLEMCT